MTSMLRSPNWNHIVILFCQFSWEYLEETWRKLNEEIKVMGFKVRNEAYFE